MPEGSEVGPVTETVELRGRKLQLYAAITLAFVLAVLTFVLWADAVGVGRGAEAVKEYTFWVLLGSTAVATLIALQRIASTRILSSHLWARAQADSSQAIGEGMQHPGRGAAHQDEPGGSAEADTVPPHRRVIACSGGGIKSAAFCLGALQALDDRPDDVQDKSVYLASNRVVAVSGGGYIASAFAARYHLGITDDQGKVLAPNGSQVGELRRRTNYLAATPRARFDLFSSLAGGMLVNLVIVSATLSVLAWLLVGHIDIIGLIRVSPTDGRLWTFNLVPGSDLAPQHSLRSFLGLWWIPLSAFVLSVLAFIRARVVAGWASGWITRSISYLPDRWQGRKSHQNSAPIASLQESTAGAFWMSNLPNAAFGAGVTIAVFYPGVPWLAYVAHNFFALHPVSAVMKAVTLTGIGTAFGIIGTVVHVATTQSPVGVELSSGQRLLGFLRAKLVPRLGVAMIVLLGYLGLVGLTGWAWDRKLPPWLLVMSAAILLGVVFFISANSSSMHPFFEDRLGYAFLPERKSPRTQRSARQPIRLSDLTTDRGPQLTLCATANIKDGDLLPSMRNGTTFVLGDTVGFTDRTLPGGAKRIVAAIYHPWRADRSPRTRKSGNATGAARTRATTRALGEGTMELSRAMAISAAAVAPLAGREDKAWGAFRLLLALANVRLGVWVRNPHWSALPDVNATRGLKLVRGIDGLLERVHPFQVVTEALGNPGIFGPQLYLSDGGHYDNLGLVQALRYEPEQIILFDGSGDAEDKFPAMGDAIASARMDLGCEIEFDPTPLQRGPDGRYPPRAWTIATARWPATTGDHPKPARSCVIRYVKCVMPQGLSWDLESYKLRTPDFPATSSKFEMYDEFDFEAYRKLGWSVTNLALDDWGFAPSGTGR